jgi:hypothetical protein
MNNYQMLNQIGGIKTRLKNLQTQSNVLKTNFFDYIEGLNSQLNVLSNLNRADFSFEVFGNKLKLKSTYDKSNDSFQGKFSIMTQVISNGFITFDELLYLNFDIHGNVKFLNETNSNYYHADFAESFYIAMMNVLIDSNKLEL